MGNRKRSTHKIVVLILNILFLFAFTANAQQITIKGNVTNASNGESLPGVNILIKGTSNGTVTDSNGMYTIKASSNDTLIYSYVGFISKQVPIMGENTINISLKENVSALGQLVVMGYTTKSQQQLTGSISQVSGENLSSETSPDPVTLLEGKSAGTFVSSTSGKPGSKSNIRIRGTGSISAGVQPLYVVDGVIAGNGSNSGLSAVAPADIKSITILKDAAATALYGSRAANGVVVIATKNGTAGKTKIDVNVSGGFSEFVRGNLQMMNSQQLYDLHQEMGDPNLSSDVLNHSTNWVDLFFRKGNVQKYGASVSGGDKKTTFYVSGDYYKEKGTLIQTNYNRLSGRINLTHQFNKKFQVTARFSGNYENSDNIAAGAHYDALHESSVLMPWDYPYNEDGTLRTGLEQNWYGREHTNPLYPVQWNYDRSNSTYFSGDLKLKYDFTDWIYFTTTNRFTMDKPQSDIYYDRRTQIGGSNNGELHKSTSTSSSILSSDLIHFDQDFGDHSIDGLFGFEYQRNHYDDINAIGIGIAPGLHVLNTTASALTNSGTEYEYLFRSELAQANYNYKDTYFVSGSIRRDGSSRFGKDNRYGLFYSGSIAWNILNESFMKGLKGTMDQMKLRGSYGTTGNADIGNYESYGLYSFSAQYANVSGSTPLRPANPDLTWEVAHTFDIGIDLDFLNRVSLTVDVYQKTNKDLLQSVKLPATSGYDSRILNVGSVRNKGIEFTLSTTNIQGKFRWTSDLNMGFNKNKVLELYQGESILNGDQRIIVGQDINTWYMRKWAGVDPDNGNPLFEEQVKDVNGNVTNTKSTSNYNDATLQIVGTASPDFTGGILNSFQYKGLSLDVFFNFVYGNEILNTLREDIDADGAYVSQNQMVLEDGWSRWEKPGDHATHPKPIYGGNRDSQKPSSRYLEDGSYLRLKNIRLSYDLPVNIFGKNSFRSVQLYVSGQNLLTISNYSGRDPEAPIGSGALGSEQYPNSKKVIFGINLGL